MNWIRSLGKSAWIAIGIFFAAMAVAKAVREKSIADKWKDKAVDIETGNVVRGIETAEAANTQAKLHNAKATERNEKAITKINQIAEKNEALGDILDKWRK